MASYKVPQDVEADDKLIGPFSFRQFIYLFIVALGIALGWGLSRLFVPLAIIPLPIVLFFGALALPLRKDQPMEIYLAAIISFYLKPRKRLWQADGIQSLIEITAPKIVEIQRSKNLSQNEAEQRLSYLANIVDSGGWAVRGVSGVQSQVATPMKDDVYNAAQNTEDILDDSTGVAHTFDTMIDQADARHRQQIISQMHQQAQAPQAPVTPLQPIISIPDPYASLVSPQTPTQPDEPDLSFNPYPEAIHQAVITPIEEQVYLPQPAVITPPTSVPNPAPIQAPEPVQKPVSPDIINLANNPDLSIETIAHEANRIHQKESLPEDEVVISLR